MPKDWADHLADLWVDVVAGMYRDKAPPKEGVATEIVKSQAQLMTAPIGEIFGDVDWNSPDYVLREYIKRNLWDFSVAKNYQEIKKLNNLLLRENGSLRPWHEFKREAQKVVGMSVRHLETEYRTIVAGGQMTRKWLEIQRDKHLFPYVRFDVVKDNRVSDICKPLDGVIVTVDDPMLAYYFPPNHFNCRTDVSRLRRATPTEKYRLPKIPEAFKNNPGVSGKIFTEKHPYFKGMQTKLLSDLDYVETDGILISTKAEKWSKSPNERPRQIAEHQRRIEVAKIMKEYLNAKQVEVLPEIKPDHWSYDFHFEKSPYPGKVTDLKIDGVYWEVESYERKFRIGKISQMISHGQEQSPYVIIKLNHKVHKLRVVEQITNLLERTDFQFLAKEVIVISNEGKVMFHLKKDRP